MCIQLLYYSIGVVLFLLGRERNCNYVIFGLTKVAKIITRKWLKIWIEIDVVLVIGLYDTQLSHCTFCNFFIWTLLNYIKCIYINIFFFWELSERSPNSLQLSKMSPTFMLSLQIIELLQKWRFYTQINNFE